MGNGMILDNPTIFGMMSGKFLGAGEAGSEAIVGTSSLMAMIQRAMASREPSVNYGGVNINVYATPNQNVNELADIIERRINLNTIRRQAAFS